MEGGQLEGGGEVGSGRVRGRVEEQMVKHRSGMMPSENSVARPYIIHSSHLPFRRPHPLVPHPKLDVLEVCGEGILRREDVQDLQVGEDVRHVCLRRRRGGDRSPEDVCFGRSLRRG